ncbi:putative baseplate assembly protein [Actinopolymorpha sp. B11F2]|uniref:putative baseplate assembly protein n=1 Tax=Actinopolymorpha sp. B11F2 TaxID=3160862 RepID=UPI0032E3884A
MTTPYPDPNDARTDITLTTAVDVDARRALVEGTSTPALDGIDAIEVLANAPGTPGFVAGAPRQRTLLVRLLRGPVPAGLGADEVLVLGGVRPDPLVNPVRVEWAYPADAVAGGESSAPVDPLPGVTPADRRLVERTTGAGERAGVLVIRTSSSGDWSTYVLKLLGPGGVGVPDGFDEPLAQAAFTFTVDCPSDLDCRIDLTCPPAEVTSPVLDYLARDYDALRTRLLDRVATLVPDWTDRNPADPGVMLVELFAAMGDRLAAWQDGVAAEAYLGTARRRTSVRRHARLLDYRMHDGCSARTWLVLTSAADVVLPAGTPAADAPDPSSPPATGPVTAVDVVGSGGVVFETCATVRLRPARNQLWLHSWGDPEHCLPAGATSAFVAREPGDADPELRAGDVLVLAPLGPDGSALTGDPTRRHAVLLDRDPVVHTDPLSDRSVVLELHWSGADALPVPLPVAERAEDGSARVVAVALANVVLADHGGTVAGERLDPPQVPVGATYRPRLRRIGLAWADPSPVVLASAAAALVPDPRTAVAELELDDGSRTWLPRPDLLASGRLAADVVVETESDGTSRLRFGDGVSGRRPVAGTTPTATYRLGGGTAGNVGPGTLARLLARPGATVPDGVTVTNPLPAVGGVDPEPIAEVRELAPHAFRTQLRAVTSDDYAAVAMRDPAVQRAVARRRWSGSWYAQEVTVDPRADRAGDPAVPAAISTVLEVRRMAGVDVELAQPVYVPLEIVLGVCVASGYQRADIAAALARAFSAGRLPDGRRGFFHPDNFTFGQSLFLSDVVATAMAVPGVAWVDVGDDGTGLRFRRLGRAPAGEVARGRIDAAAREVLRADTDPSNPENGRFTCLLRGRA